MLYQLAMYATTHRQNVVTILHPTIEHHAKESRVALREPIYGTDIGQVQLWPVGLQTLEAFSNERSAPEKASYASWLAFGRWRIRRRRITRRARDRVHSSVLQPCDFQIRSPAL